MRTDILIIATAEIGYKETPANSNKTKFGKWFGLDGMAWCAMFVSWCFNQANSKLPAINMPGGYSGCQHAFKYFTKMKLITISPRPADIALFDWNGDGRFDHTGIFEKDNGDGTFMCIEGNTAVGNDSNGGEVMRRKRSYKVAVFIDVTTYLK